MVTVSFRKDVEEVKMVSDRTLDVLETVTGTAGREPITDVLLVRSLRMFIEQYQEKLHRPGFREISRQIVANNLVDDPPEGEDLRLMSNAFTRGLRAFSRHLKRDPEFFNQLEANAQRRYDLTTREP